VATTQPATRLFDDSFLKFLPAPLREPRRAWLAIPTAWALSFAGSLVLALVVQALAPGLSSPEIPNLPAGLILFAFVIFAPLAESIIMGAILVVLLRWLSPVLAILISALAWGVFHSLQASAWGLAIWWPFLIFSTLFVVWRQRGFWTGVGVATAAHMLQNLGPAIALIYRTA
jgi:membrane protease YdiL (CAAX protease family)